MATKAGRWVLLSYRLPREPSTPRISVWRKFKTLGVVQLGDGLVALPSSNRNQEQLEWVAAEVREAGGEASIWLAVALGTSQEKALISSMREQVSEEYRALVGEARSARREASAARRRTIARLRRELHKIRQRDYFAAPAMEDARRAIEELSASVKVAL